MHAKLENMAKVSYRAELKAVLDDDYQKTEDSLDTPLKRFVLMSVSFFSYNVYGKSAAKGRDCRKDAEEKQGQLMSSGIRQNGFTGMTCLVCQATFLSLLKGEDYILTIKTLLNGFPVGQITEKFNTDKLGSLLKKELTEDEDDKKEVEEETSGAQEEKEEDVEEEDPNRLQKQEMQENVEEEMEKVNKDRKKSMNSDATVAVENTEQEPQKIKIYQSIDIFDI